MRRGKLCECVAVGKGKECKAVKSDHQHFYTMMLWSSLNITEEYREKKGA